MDSAYLKVIRVACISCLVSMAFAIFLLSAQNIKPSWEMNAVAIVALVGFGYTTQTLRWREMKDEEDREQEDEQSQDPYRHF